MCNKLLNKKECAVRTSVMMALLAFSTGSYAASPQAPVINGVSQVSITMTGDDGG